MRNFTSQMKADIDRVRMMNILLRGYKSRFQIIVRLLGVILDENTSTSAVLGISPLRKRLNFLAHSKDVLPERTIDLINRVSDVILESDIATKIAAAERRVDSDEDGKLADELRKSINPASLLAPRKQMYASGDPLVSDSNSNVGKRKEDSSAHHADDHGRHKRGRTLRAAQSEGDVVHSGGNIVPYTGVRSNELASGRRPEGAFYEGNGMFGAAYHFEMSELADDIQGSYAEDELDEATRSENEATSDNESPPPPLDVKQEQQRANNIHFILYESKEYLKDGNNVIEGLIGDNLKDILDYAGEPDKRALLEWMEEEIPSTFSTEGMFPAS